MAIYSIYRFTNIVNGKVYIGKTTQQPRARYRNHINAAAKGSMSALHCAIRKHGEANFKFEVIFNCFASIDLDEHERLFITEHNCCVLDTGHVGYNMTRGGDGNTTEIAKMYAKRLLDENRHNFQGEKAKNRASTAQKAKIDAGTHPWAGNIGSVNATKRNAKRVAAGTHPFCGSAGSKHSTAMNKKRVANGTHPFQGEEAKIRQKEVASRIHVCPHCSKEGKGNGMKRFHFERCKMKIT